MLRVECVDFVSVPTRDIARARHFYGEILGLPASRPVHSRVEQSYAQRILALPLETRLLALAAAAEPSGDPVLLQRAAAILGLDMAALGPAMDAGLVDVAGRVEFAHPLARSAAYHSAAIDDRHHVHRALAEATDAERDPDRRAWHRARATRPSAVSSGWRAPPPPTGFAGSIQSGWNGSAATRVAYIVG